MVETHGGPALVLEFLENKDGASLKATGGELSPNAKNPPLLGLLWELCQEFDSRDTFQSYGNDIMILKLHRERDFVKGLTRSTGQFVWQFPFRSCRGGLCSHVRGSRGHVFYIVGNDILGFRSCRQRKN